MLTRFVSHTLVLGVLQPAIAVDDPAIRSSATISRLTTLFLMFFIFDNSSFHFVLKLFTLMSVFGLDPTTVQKLSHTTPTTLQ